jgi:hypothetical protein
MWQGPSLDLLRQVHEETQHQDRIEACGYRSATWRILRALKSINRAKAIVGESAITAAPFFERAGRPSNFFWEPLQGNKVILWESLSAEEKEESQKALHKEKGWVIWCKDNPKNKGVQAFREHSRSIFTGRRKESRRDKDSREEAPGGQHVTRARSWWKRGDVSACAAQTNMECWVYQDIILDDDKAHQSVKEEWEHEHDKDELKIALQGLERQFWLGTEAGRLGCYDFSGETWAGDGSANNGEMGAGSVCLQRQDKCLVVRAGREEEGVNSLRPDWQQWLGLRTLQATPSVVDLLNLFDSETTLDKVSRWIGSGSRTTLAGNANADIMKTIIECVRERVIRGARIFMVKVKAHRGDPLHERVDTQAERARQLPPECREWTTSTSRMLYTWQDKGVKRVSTWSKAVRRAMHKGGAEFQRQKVLNRAAGNWNKEFLRTTDTGVARIRQVACTGVKCDLRDSTLGVGIYASASRGQRQKSPSSHNMGRQILA